jgi:hypothetical protein
MNPSDKDFGFVDYVFTLTDDVGIFQHSVYGIPDPRKGYTTDDNSRALILAVMLLERFEDRQYLKLVSRYLSFMLNAQNDDGSFKNFMNYNREFIEEKGSEDCFGRCLWSLGRTISSPAVPENIKRTCRYILDKSLKCWPKLTSPRAKAYTIIGLSYLKKTNKIASHIDVLSMELLSQYSQFKDKDWNWFEDSMTYGNALLPWSLLRAYRILKKEALLETACESMEFVEKQTFRRDYFKPIGCKGWLVKGKKAAEYDEQPIEACETLLLYMDYYEMTKDIKYLDYAAKCFGWYAGKNSKGLSLLDQETGACYDGLTKEGLNYNQGSESIVSYGIAFLKITEKAKVPVG